MSLTQKKDLPASLLACSLNLSTHVLYVAGAARDAAGLAPTGSCRKTILTDLRQYLVPPHLELPEGADLPTGASWIESLALLIVDGKSDAALAMRSRAVAAAMKECVTTIYGEDATATMPSPGSFPVLMDEAQVTGFWAQQVLPGSWRALLERSSLDAAVLAAQRDQDLARGCRLLVGPLVQRWMVRDDKGEITAISAPDSDVLEVVPAGMRCALTTAAGLTGTMCLRLTASGHPCTLAQGGRLFRYTPSSKAGGLEEKLPASTSKSYHDGLVQLLQTHLTTAKLVGALPGKGRNRIRCKAGCSGCNGEADYAVSFQADMEEAGALWLPLPGVSHGQQQLIASGGAFFNADACEQNPALTAIPVCMVPLLGGKPTGEVWALTDVGFRSCPKLVQPLPTVATVVEGPSTFEVVPHFVGLHVVPRPDTQVNVAPPPATLSSHMAPPHSWGVMYSDCLSPTAVLRRRAQWCANPLQPGSLLSPQNLLQGAATLATAQPPTSKEYVHCLAAVGYTKATADKESSLFAALKKQLPWCSAAGDSPLPVAELDRLLRVGCVAAVGRDSHPVVVINLKEEVVVTVKAAPHEWLTPRTMAGVLSGAGRHGDGHPAFSDEVEDVTATSSASRGAMNLANGAGGQLHDSHSSRDVEYAIRQINDTVHGNLPEVVVGAARGSTRGKRMTSLALTAAMSPSGIGAGGALSPPPPQQPLTAVLPPPGTGAGGALQPPLGLTYGTGSSRTMAHLPLSNPMTGGQSGNQQ